jgi:hypothetical protein
MFGSRNGSEAFLWSTIIIDALSFWRWNGCEIASGQVDVGTASRAQRLWLNLDGQ